MRNTKGTNQILATLRRFHMVIFFAAVVIGLAVAIFLLNGVVARTNGSAEASGSNAARFDQDTIDRIDELKTSSEPGDPLNFSGGRVSPFSE